MEKLIEKLKNDIKEFENKEIPLYLTDEIAYNDGKISYALELLNYLK
jgi:hypothetical protein